MNILVIDIAASIGGAKTILEKSCEEFAKDAFNTYYLCTSLVNIENNENIINLCYPKAKRPFINRIYFDLIETKKLIKKYKIDKVISLQNIGLFFVKLPQTLYIHQSLPFAEKKYSFLENSKYWFYQNIFSYIQKKSLKYVDQIIVQTDYMKNAIIKKYNYNERNIMVQKPIITDTYNYQFDINKWDGLFFYPTSSEEYKKFDIIFNAANIILNDNPKQNNIKFILTLNKEDLNHECLNVYNRYPNNFELVGYLKQDRIYEYYEKSILLFPSIIESLGMPLLEAMSIGTMIIASDTTFAKELLAHYNNKIFFEKNNYKELSEIIQTIIDKYAKK